MRREFPVFSSSRLSRGALGLAFVALASVAASPGRAGSSESQPAASQPSAPVLTGFWTAYNDDGKPGGVFYFYENNGLYEGRLVKEIAYPGDPPENPLCTRCPGEKKDKPMLGLVIVWGMKKHGEAKYENGHVLDPRNGSVWSAQLEVTPDNQKLNLRGYLGTPLLGQTRVWTRLPDDTMALADIPGDPIPGLVPPPAAPLAKKHAPHHAPHGGAHASPDHLAPAPRVATPDVQ
ncbi:DUF2147 domain-containing protein [Rhodoblastus sp.]|uniref:DUF2147 domain-containing protein n=1 Tax=Rhodoblastus sp. TaxID=1962975 RepID=UPI00260C4D95|nr:DUF2147 domain-containing protein [Rhodoblastus sp.]